MIWKRLALMSLLAVSGIIILVRTTTHAQDSTLCTPASFSREWAETDFCNTSIDLDEILSGGPPKDGIPAVNEPQMESIAQASEWLGDRSPVIAVEIDGAARAYPQAVLIWHEIANDEINGVPVAVTFCPLCNSSIVFDRRVGDQTLTFGVSGKLRNSDMIMYDRETQSWWQQFIGEGIVGVQTGVLLDVVPSRVIGFGQFKERYPDGLVMSRTTGFRRDYGVNPYVGYDSGNPYPFFFASEDIDPRLPATEHVLAGVVGGQAVAYGFVALSEEVVINDTIGGVEVLALWQPGAASSLDKNRIDDSRDIGTASLYERALDGQVLTFAVNADGQIVDNETGSVWNLFGEAVEGDLSGKALKQLVAAPHFWFAWAAFQPETLVYGQ